MTAPVAGEMNFAVGCSDPNLSRDDINSNSSEDTQPLVLWDPSLSKHLKSKPTRFTGSQTYVQMEIPSPKTNIVVSDGTGSSSSLQKQKSPTKSFEAQVISSPTMVRAVDVQSKLELNDGKTATLSLKTKKNKHPESLSSVGVQKRLKKPQQRGNDNKEVGSKVVVCPTSSKPHLSFQEVTSFEDFRILVNGVGIDHELSDDDRMGYYNLCFYKKEFLHPEDVNGILVGGMIAEIVKIGNEIKKCKLTTAKEEFEKWDKYLKSFEGLGMKVGFLRDKICTLARLVSDSKGALDVKQYMEATKEHKRIKDELKKVEAKLKELKESAKKIGGISGILKAKVEKYEQKFKEEVDAPW